MALTGDTQKSHHIGDSPAN